MVDAAGMPTERLRELAARIDEHPTRTGVPFTPDEAARIAACIRAVIAARELADEFANVATNYRREVALADKAGHYASAAMFHTMAEDYVAATQGIRAIVGGGAGGGR